MRNAWLVRALVAIVALLLVGWVVHKTSWVEVERDDPAHGAAADDRYYALRAVLRAAGSTLETRTSLEPLPPAGATLVLDSALWTIFPERDARLKAWVEAGGHLVVFGWQAANGDGLRWVPIAFRSAPAPRATKPASAASIASDDDDDDDDPSDDDDPPALRRTPPAPAIPAGLLAKQAPRRCATFVEPASVTHPAFEPGRRYAGCFYANVLKPLRVAPDWQLVDERTAGRAALALRVPVGRGSVTGTWAGQFLATPTLLKDDDALIAAAILQAAPGRAVWIVDDEARDPLAKWLWQQARAPLLLAAAAVAFALWRLLVRFGPREAAPPVARRSMGEQVRGTGDFIAAHDPAAPHAATRDAFDDAVRLRVQDAAGLDEPERLAAVAARVAPHARIDVAALQAALHPGPLSTTAQWLAAIAVVEEARRALLAATAPPPA